MVASLQVTLEPLARTCELVTNGDFEQGPVGFNVTTDSGKLSGWNFFSIRTANGQHDAHSGDWFLFAEEVGTINQTLGSCPGVAPACTLSLYLQTGLGKPITEVRAL